MTRCFHLGCKQKKYPKSYSVYSAFGLVEVVLAMFILTTALTVVMLPAIRTIQYTKQNRQAVLAAYLAQEGVEIIRNIRDTQFAQFDKNKATLDKAFDMDTTETVKACSIDYTTTALGKIGDTLSNCKANSLFSKEDGALILNNDFYESSPGNSDAVFWRKAVIRRITRGSNIRYDVEVYVIWGTGRYRAPATCTRSNKCVFSQATVTNWNYWSE